MVSLATREGRRPWGEAGPCEAPRLTTSPAPAHCQRLQRPAHSPHRRGEGAGPSWRLVSACSITAFCPSSSRSRVLTQASCARPTPGLRVSGPAHLASSACGQVSRPPPCSPAVSNYPAACVRALLCGEGALLSRAEAWLAPPAADGGKE